MSHNPLRRAVASAIDTSHPIVNSLGRTFGGFLPGQRLPLKGLQPKNRQPEAVSKGQLPRCDVVDEKLCDDLVEYLAPTLEQYKGCTLIDIHPGACLWSRKLHDLLQPKRHLLMEPDDRYVEPFIQPLLDMPGSRYLYTPLSGVHSQHMQRAFNEVVEDDTLDFDPFRPNAATGARELNTDLLITGSLARRFFEARSRNNAVMQCDFVLQALCWGSLLNHTFHRTGLVRQLWWYPEQCKRTVLPRRLSHKTGFNIGLLLGCNITEAAGTAQTSAYAREERGKASKTYVPDTHPSIKRQISRAVQERMTTAGMKVPPGREILASLSAEEEEQHAKLRSPVEIRLGSVSELENELVKVDNRLNKVVEVSIESNRVKKARRATELFQELSDTLEYPQCDAIVRDYAPLFVVRKGKAEDGDMFPSRHRISKLMDVQLRIINLEAHVKHFEEQGEDVKEIASRVIALDKKLGSSIHEISFGPTIQEHVDALVQDQLALFASPQPLASDQRRYEALKADTENFWPRADLCLLDVTPVPRDLNVPGIADRAEVSITAKELIKHLLTARGELVSVTLDKIAPNAAKDVMPMVPSFSDPRKGGRLNVDALRVKMITEDMLEELVKAWFEWPFAPTFNELALSTTSIGDMESSDSALHSDMADED